MHIYTSKVREADTNTRYPIEKDIRGINELLTATQFDHIAAKTRDGRRGNDYFITADGIISDLDNSHSEDPDDWKTLDDVQDAFPDVAFYYVESRNHMKPKSKTEKDGKVIHYAPRPKYHLYFPSSKAVDADGYKKVILTACGVFPYLDPAAVDITHFIYGVKDPKGGYIDGSKTLDEYIDTVSADECIENIKKFIADGFSKGDKAFKKVPEFFGIGSEPKIKNVETGSDWISNAEKEKSVRWFRSWSTTYDVEILGEYEINTSAHPKATVFCVPCPWEDEHSVDGGKAETVVIIDITGKLNFLCRHGHDYGWKEYREKIESQKPTVIINTRAKAKTEPVRRNTLEPEDRTDVGQSEVFVSEYGDIIRYSRATGFLIYDGQKWCEDDLKAQKLSQELTARQLKEAKKKLQQARAELDKLVEAEDQDPEAIKVAQAAVNAADGYRKYVLGRRATAKIKATLTETAPLVQVAVKELDADGYLLNTPGGTVDLRTGQMKPHDPDDYCTKITAVAPGRDGSDIWLRFLDDITVKDKDLKRYLQDVAGLCAIGEVKREELIIAFGGGSNGKSTFFNLLFRVLGEYSGMLSAETLTTNCRKNKSPEYAELRGKRLIIAAELEEAQRLDTSVMKKLCSTDPIIAEKKYKDPFTFIPSHHCILYTNHLPKVGTNDNGTWRRLVTVPFRARFDERSGQIKDYASYLYDHCAGIVLLWIIQGAKRVIDQEYHFEQPYCVKETLEQYKEENDWLQMFLHEKCEQHWSYVVSGGDLYEAYKIFCHETGDFMRNRRDFVQAIEEAGFQGRKTKAGKIYKGLQLMSEFKQGIELKNALIHTEKELLGMRYAEKNTLFCGEGDAQ